MNKGLSYSEIKEQTISDFCHLMALVEHGVINYTYFKNSTTVLVNSFISALTEERKPNITRGKDHE